MAEITLTIRPFEIPSIVYLRMPPPHQAVTLAIERVDGDVLSQMCDEFRRGVFEKAGKIDQGSLSNLEISAIKCDTDAIDLKQAGLDPATSTETTS